MINNNTTETNVEGQPSTVSKENSLSIALDNIKIALIILTISIIIEYYLMFI